ncbi:hypothetical protein Trco_007842 [Trichoderma cornu-damae]|uniref:Uncharacterized protein n=1 Tax=Trichoderma cornu-damae TaxID=654480 RepID=A0A9P8QGF4_9HYPO|nr:hypothetical protein Trco_007842 [Trichoderma cornu-damae]
MPKWLKAYNDSLGAVAQAGCNIDIVKQYDLHSFFQLELNIKVKHIHAFIGLGRSLETPKLGIIDFSNFVSRGAQFDRMVAHGRVTLCEEMKIRIAQLQA